MRVKRVQISVICKNTITGINRQVDVFSCGIGIRHGNRSIIHIDDSNGRCTCHLLGCTAIIGVGCLNSHHVPYIILSQHIG